MKINGILKKFKQKRILIFGDSILDKYYFGNINRHSPESDIPIVDIIKTEFRLGGAGNVALNIQNLGGYPILFSVLGNDFHGKEYLKLLNKNGIETSGISIIKKIRTTTKHRVISNSKHIARFDEDEIINVKEEKILKKFDNIISKCDIDVLLVQDYNKGLLSLNIINHIISKCKNFMIPIVVDPKKNNFFSYKFVDIFKPNLKEINDAFNSENNLITSKSDIEFITSKLQKKINAKVIILTLSENGMCLKSEDKYYYEKPYSKDVIDVSGAGDTVISIAALSLAANINNEIIIKISNLAAGLVCKKIGVSPILKKDINYKSLNIS